MLQDWGERNRTTEEAVQIIGERWALRSQELRDMFRRNKVAAGFYDSAQPAGQELLSALGLSAPELPVVVLRFRPDRPVLINPNAIEIAAAFGLMDRLERPRGLRRGRHRCRSGRAECCGLRLVGGLRTVVVEPLAMGGRPATAL